MTTKTKKPRKPRAPKGPTGKKRGRPAKQMPETNGEPIEIDSDRMAAAKQAEQMVEDSGLAHDEAKAKYNMTRAEHKLCIARRNRKINQTDDPKVVEDAQREVYNAEQRMNKARSIAKSARDEFLGAQERLAKALTERLPLFDGKKKKTAESNGDAK